MFDDRDADFCRTNAEPRLGVPVLTDGAHGPRIIFLGSDLFAFDEWFDEHNAEFVRTGAMPRLPPPAMFADGWVRCIPEHQRYRKCGVWYKREAPVAYGHACVARLDARADFGRRPDVHSVSQGHVQIFERKCGVRGLRPEHVP